jgi:hypothetical protein
MLILALCATSWALSGCQHCALTHSCYQSPPVEPLGCKNDVIWKRQEAAAEASDFVVYQHEFVLNGTTLNEAGEDHVKQIAARLTAGQDLPVVVERSNTTAREDTEYKYPVHSNPEMDLQRREVLVRCLTAMGINDAEQRVLIAPAYAAGVKATEAQSAYNRGLQGTNQNANAFGGVGGIGSAGGIGGIGIF